MKHCIVLNLDYVEKMNVICKKGGKLIRTPMTEDGKLQKEVNIGRFKNSIKQRENNQIY